MDLAIERRDAAIESGAAVTLVLRGRIDSETSASLESAVEEELRRGTGTIRLDAADVTFLSSAGIRSLFNATRAAKNAGSSCLIAVASDPVSRVLTLARLAPMLMERAAPAPVPGPSTGRPAPAATPVPRPERHGDLLLHADDGAANPVEGRLVGRHALGAGTAAAGTEPLDVSRHTFGIGIGVLADDGPADARGGELVAAAGSVFVRPPRPFGTPDSLVGAGDLVPAVRMVSGIFWEGTPAGRASFEPADDTATGLATLVGALLERLRVDALAVALVAEVRGLVGAELIRPLGDATPDDHPATGRAETTARWLAFSREPVHAGRTALVVGIATREAGGLGGVVAPLGPDAGPWGHFHAAVFPHRPLRRGAGGPGAVIDDLGGSAPLAVMHLLADPEPLLGSGASEFVRGLCWYAPLRLRGDDS